MNESLIARALVPDLNGDGRADLILLVFDGTSQYDPVIRYGKVDGTFSDANPLVSFKLQFSPIVVAAGDFNHDGHSDLVFIGGQGGSPPTYQILLNNGTGHFNTAGSGDLPSTSPFIAPSLVADFNRDGSPDFAYGGATNGQALSLYFGDGVGTLGAGVAYGPAGGSTYQVNAADVNGDGYTDLVYLYIPSNGGNQMRALLSASDGSFTDSQLTGFPTPCAGFVVGDFNNDHIPDIFAVDSRGKGRAYLGLGNGAFNATGTPVVASDLYLSAPPFVTADFDLDGNADVATRTQLSGPDEILFLFGDGKGNFVRQIQVSDHSFTLQVGDVNGDGIADIFAAGEAGFAYSSVILGRSDRNFPSAQVLLPLVWGNLSFGDVFGDGFNDIHVGGLGDGGFGSIPGTIYHFQPDGTFSAQGQAPGYGTELVDLNGDGIADMVGFGSTSLLFWRGDGSGVFQVPINEVSLPNGFQPICYRDMDGDGHMDIVVPGLILYGKGNFQFDAAPIEFYQNFLVGDFDGDHMSDIATPSGILFGQGGRTFTAPTGISPLQNNPGPFLNQAVGDLNGDGMDDLVVNTAIYISIGRQGFAHDQTLMVNGYAGQIGSIAIADFNGDGLPDIAIGLLGGGEDVVVYTDDGTGKYQMTSYTVGVGSVFSIAGDFNRDGKPDLAFRGFLLNFVPPTVTVLLGDKTR